MKQTLLFCRRGMVTMVAMLFCMAALAQVTVTGNVVDAANDEPVIGASVLEIGTSNGTITDWDGNFTLTVQAGAKLSISYMGYKTQELAASSVMKVRLAEDSELLEEVVVVGYGVVKKNDATGSVTAIKPDDMNKGLVTNAQDMMQGKIAGVQVTSASGAPGAGATIRIRGGSSLSASNDPLIVIDGLAMDNNGIQGVSNPLAMINPNDIETFTVLKDASATAIYGSRASNGVIIITTKKGAAGSKLKVSYDANVSAGILTQFNQVMTSDQYRSYITQHPDYQANAGQLGSAATDWQKEIYRVGIGTDHSISLVGGTKNMPYRASIGYTLQNGTIKTSQMQRVTAAVNLNPTFLDKHLTFNINAKGMYIYNRYADGGAVGASQSMNPTVPVNIGEGDPGYKEYGGYYQVPTSPGSDWKDSSWKYITNSNVCQNPVALLKLKNDRANSGSLVGNIEADYKIHGLEDLRLHANFGADYSFGRQHTVIQPTAYSNNYYGWDGYETKAKYNLQFNAYAQYYKDFNDNHHFDVMAGYEWQHFHTAWASFGHGLYQETYDDKANLPLLEDGSVDMRYNINDKSSLSESFLVSFFGRVNYIALNRYMVTATLRADGSSRFAKGHQWGLFPSVALGWKIKEEAFLRDVRWLSELKLRLGYGITGQQDLGQGDYPAMALYQMNQAHAYYPLGETDPVTGDYIYYPSYRPNAYNSNLTWEKTTTYNAGIDFGFLNARITGNIDYYYRLTTDLISEVDVAAGTNFSNKTYKNIGNLMNQGVEIMLNAVAIDRKNFKWDLGLNFTYNENKITKLTIGEGKDYYVTTGDISAGTGNTIQRHQEGYPAGTFFVYQTVQDEFTGMWEIVDQPTVWDEFSGTYVGDGQINEKDLVAYHNSMPDFTLGFQTKFQFYGVDLSISLRSNIGNYVYNDVLAGKMTTITTPYRDGAFSNFNTTALDIYDKHIVGSSSIKIDKNAFFIDQFVENGSFLRCDNITLGYTFKPTKVNARVYATISNPFIISKYRGLDPEVFGGIDNNIYPRSMTAIIGTSIQF